MPASTRRIYFDANVFLAYISDEKGRAATVQSVLEEARRGEVEIVTSILSIAEVAYAAHEVAAELTSDGESAIDELWKPASPITLVDASEATSREARRLIRKSKTEAIKTPGSIDAMHLATASIHGCVSIFTYEKDTSRAAWAKLTGIRVTEPETMMPQLDI
jgi:predicted nucleic acid-binding protein